MSQSLVRFIIGGAMVSVFAIIGDVLKPKSFAGLFGAAPSVALATLAMTILSDGSSYANPCLARCGGGRLLLHLG